MPTFDRGEVVRVPFPYTNRPVQQRRPAIVVSSAAFNQSTHLLWVLMVTSAENREWPGDVSLAENFAQFGLPAPSIVRTTKIATIESSTADRIGVLSNHVMRQIDEQFRRHLGL